MTSPIAGPLESPLSGNPPRQLIVLLHGYGSNGDDLFGLVPVLAPHFPDAQFLSPNAPFPCAMNPQGGYEWFDLSTHSPHVMFAGAQDSAALLDNFLDAQLKKYGLADRQLALAGFSQGTMMALHVALRRPSPMAGVVGFSGALLGPDVLRNEIRSRPPVCLIHGTMDSVVPFQAMQGAEAVLKDCKVPVETYARPGLPHSIDNEGLTAAVAFLKKCFT